MSSKPFIPWFFSDLVGDTLHLTNAQFGSYCLLLGAMWNAGGYLPDDPDELARIGRVRNGGWPGTWRALQRFFVAENGTITQKNLLARVAKHRDISTSRAQASAVRWSNSAGVLSRGSTEFPLSHPKPLKSNKPRHASGYAKRMQPEPEKKDDPKGSYPSSPQQLAASPSGRPDGPTGDAGDQKGSNVNRNEARAEIVATMGEDFAVSTFDRALFQEGPPMILQPATGWAYGNLDRRAGGILRKHGIKLERPLRAVAPVAKQA